MINISQLTKDPKEFARALVGKWERHAEEGCTWVILGQIAFVEGDKTKFPYSVISWHDQGTGHWGILQ